jgi:uncharacterized membrane protein YdjX (TVP38/TMEM64 family)
MKTILLLLVLLMFAGSANAYIGPGMGGGVIAAILGILGSVLLAFFAVLYYPIKRMLKKKKTKEPHTRVERKTDKDGDQDEDIDSDKSN